MIHQQTIADVAGDDLFVDHQEPQRVGLYFGETDFPHVPDDLLGCCLRRAGDKADIILLDSGGHMGHVEFNYVLKLLKSPCHVVLDDIHHVKHHQSYQQLVSDPRFTVLFSADEKFGFCIARFDPVVLDKNARPKRPLVTAIVSTYNAERFIGGCLEDLEAQTIADQLEIIVVNSGSQQNESAIVAQFQQRHANICCIHTVQRETVYAAWNRAVQVARGKYITNANTDDRHRPDALQIMAHTLDSHPDVALVYADTLITQTPGDTFARNTPTGWYRFLDWDRQKLLEGVCFMGPQPMWRASVHEEYGYFDADMVTSGDYEFWLRISQTHRFMHIPQVLGLYLKRPDSIEHTHREAQAVENERILKMYRQAQMDRKVIRRVAGEPGKPVLPPSVSIVVTAHQPSSLVQCLDCIARAADLGAEVLIAAESAAIGPTGLAHARGPHRWVRSEKGVFAAMNDALVQARGRYVFVLHDGVRVTAGGVQGLIDSLEADPQTGVVFPAAVAASADGLENLNALAALFKSRYRHRRICGSTIDGHLLAFRKSILDQVGLPDEAMGGYCRIFEDWRLRVRLAGLNVVMAGDVLIGLGGEPPAEGDRGAFIAKWGGVDPASETGLALLRLQTSEAAEKYRQQGRMADAADKLLEGIGRFPGFTGFYRQLARMLAERRAFDQALQVLAEMPNDPIDLASQELLATILEGLGRTQEAEDLADGVLVRNPRSAPALNLKGILASGRGQADKALAYFKESANADPGWGEPHANQATVLWNEGRLNEALDLYENGFVLSPVDLDIAALYHGAVAHFEAWARARVVVEDAVALFPDSRKLLDMLVDAMFNQGEMTAALDQIQQAVVLFGLDDGLAEKALQIRRRIGPLAVDSPNRQRPAVSLCLIVKDEEKHLARCLASAAPVVDEIVVVDTGSVDRTREIAEIFGARVYDHRWGNDFAQARNQYLQHAQGHWILVLDADEVLSALDYEKIRRTVAQPPELAYTVVTRNYTAKANTIGWQPNQGQYPAEEAGNGWVPTWKVRLFPNDPRIRYHFPVHEFVEPSLKQIGMPCVQWEVPVHHYGKLDDEKTKRKNDIYYELGIRKLEETGNDPHALREMAVQAGVLEHFEEAIDLWRRFLGLCPDVGEAYINLSTAYFGAGRYDEAAQAAHQAMALAPAMTESAYNLAVIQMHRGHIEQAIALMENVVASQPDYQPARFVLTACYFGNGNDTQAEQGLEHLKRTPLGRVLAVSFFTLAETLIKAGQQKMADTILSAAVVHGFVNDDVRRLLDRNRKTSPLGRTAVQRQEMAAA
jgi:glycosyltransferase involved in cell wall biosynthesis